MGLVHASVKNDLQHPLICRNLGNGKDGVQSQVTFLRRNLFPRNRPINHHRSRPREPRQLFHDAPTGSEILRTLLEYGMGSVTTSKAAEARRITLSLRYEGFETHTRQMTLDCPTQSDDKIVCSAVSLFDQFPLDHKVGLLGAGSGDLTQTPNPQTTMTRSMEPWMPSAQSSETPPFDEALNDSSGINVSFGDSLRTLQIPACKTHFTRDNSIFRSEILVSVTTSRMSGCK